MVSVACKHRRTGETALSAEETCAGGREHPNDCADMTTEWHQAGAPAVHAGPGVFARRFRGLIACLLFAMSLPVFANCARVSQTCEQDELQREDKYEFQLAVCQEGGWHICEHNRTSTPYYLTVPSDDEVDFFWAVPASGQHELIYVSTSYRDQQPLSIARSATYETPALFSILAPFREIRKVFRDREEIRRLFLEYHDDLEDDHPEDHPVFSLLAAWHDTEIWGPLKSYALVCTSLAVRRDPSDVGAERLIRLAEGRPKMSWAGFDSLFKEGRDLRITLAYSGYSKEPRIWRFMFKVQVADENER